ncbi:MAG: FecR domain-containing protein [Desulfosporosinus sp.]
MNRRRSIGMKFWFILILFILVIGADCIFNTPIAKAEEGISAAKLDDVRGSVLVKHGGGYHEYEGFNGMPLEQGDTVLTSTEATAKIIFESGSETSIDAESEVVIATLNTDGTSSQISLRLWTGSIWNKVKSLLNIDDHYEVETPTAVMGVRGTLYMVNVDRVQGTSMVGVMDGAVADRPNQGEVVDSLESIVSMGEELNQTIEGPEAVAKQPIDMSAMIAKVQPQMLSTMIPDVTSRTGELLSLAKGVQSNYAQSQNPEFIKSALVLAEKASRLVDLGKNFVEKVKLSDKAVDVNVMLKESNLSLEQIQTQLGNNQTEIVQVQETIKQDAKEAGLTEEDIEDIISEATETITTPGQEDNEPTVITDNDGGGGSSGSSSPTINKGSIDNHNNTITLALSQEIKAGELVVNEGEVPWAVSLSLADDKNYWVGLWGENDVVSLQTPVVTSGKKLVLSTNVPIYGQYIARLCTGIVSKSEYVEQDKLDLVQKGIVNGIAKLSGATDHSDIKIVANGLTLNGQSVTVSTVTLKDGSFILKDLQEGQYLLEASKTGYLKTNEVVDVIGGKTISLENELVLYSQSATGSVNGYAKFVDRQNQSGIGVRVQTNEGKLLPNLIAKTDAQGYFSIEGVPVDSMTLQENYILTAFALDESLSYNTDSIQVTIQANQSVTLPETLWIRPSDSNLIIFADDNTPWDRYALRDMLGILGVEAEDSVYTSTAMSTLSLPVDKTVWIVNDQPQAFYNTYKDNEQKFDDFVKQGGTLLFEACDSGWNGGSMASVGATLPGGVVNNQAYDWTNTNVNPSHPMMAGIPITLSGNYASHDYFTELPQNSTVLAENPNNMPTLVEYKYEKGRVIATGQPLEFYWGQEGLGRIYSNMVYYTLNKPISAGLTAPYFTLSAGDDTVQPTRSQDTLTYQANVGHDVDMITITPSAECGNIIIDGNVVSSGHTSNPIYLDFGLNTLRIVVAEQGKLPKAYTVMVTRATTPPPEIQADNDNNITGEEMELTFTDDPEWRQEITEVQVDGLTISPSSYTVNSGIILLSRDSFPIARDYNINVKAYSYSDASVKQTVIPNDNQPKIFAIVGNSVHAGSDEIKLIFDRPMNNASGALRNKANWKIILDDDNTNSSDGDETTLKLTNATLAYDGSKNELTIQLNEIKDSAFIPPARYIYVSPSKTKIKDLKGKGNIQPAYSGAVTEVEAISPSVNPQLVYVDKNHLKLQFSEQVNPMQAIDINNYTLSGTEWFNGYPIEVALCGDKKSVIIKVPDLSVLQPEDNLWVTVLGVQDLVGNDIDQENNTAVYGEAASLVNVPYFGGSTLGETTRSPY